MVPAVRIELNDLQVTKLALYRLSYTGIVSNSKMVFPPPVQKKFLQE
jgi:hypothetical protein